MYTGFISNLSIELLTISRYSICYYYSNLLGHRLIWLSHLGGQCKCWDYDIVLISAVFCLNQRSLSRSGWQLEQAHDHPNVTKVIIRHSSPMRHTCQRLPQV